MWRHNYISQWICYVITEITFDIRHTMGMCNKFTKANVVICIPETNLDVKQILSALLDSDKVSKWKSERKTGRINDQKIGI